MFLLLFSAYFWSTNHLKKDHGKEVWRDVRICKIKIQDHNTLFEPFKYIHPKSKNKTLKLTAPT